MKSRHYLLLFFFFGFSYARANTKPVNDECSGAINVVAGANLATYSVAGSTLSMPGCIDTVVNDTWYKFKATGTRMRLSAITASGTSPVVVQVFTGTCGNLTSLTCYRYNDGSADLMNLTVGATYYYRICLTPENETQTSIATAIEAIPLSYSPANDEPAGAIALQPDSSYSLSLGGQATPSLPPVANGPNEANDVWYTFIPYTADNYVEFTPFTNAAFDYVYQVFSGTPGNLTSLGYVIDPNYTGNMSLVFTTLTPGQTYYIRVYDYNGAATSAEDYGIRIASVPPPANDECTGAVNVPTTGATVKSSLAGATLSMPACADTAYNDIWFKFTATGTRHQIYAEANAILPFRKSIIQVFSGSCGNLTALSCSDYADNYADISGLTPGVTYYYRVYPDGEKNTQSSLITHILTPGTPPANDEPAGAQPVAVNATYTGLSLGYATQTFAPCNTTDTHADDIWYSFVATTTRHNIAISEYNEPLYSWAFQVYSGTPASLTSLACVSGASATTDSVTISNLTVGKTYYIRVYNYQSVATPSLQFDLKVSSESPAVEPKVATGSTAYTIYPNPAHTFLYVQNGNKNMPAFTIGDLTGRLYLSGRLTSNQINIGQLPRGSFVLTIRDGATPTSILFTKE